MKQKKKQQKSENDIDTAKKKRPTCKIKFAVTWRCSTHQGAGRCNPICADDVKPIIPMLSTGKFISFLSPFYPNLVYTRVGDKVESSSATGTPKTIKIK